MVFSHSPDLILLDLSEPNRWNLLKALRADSHLATTPTIVLTTNTSLQDMMTAIELDANEFIMQPYTLREASGRIRARLCMQKRAEVFSYTHPQ